jgi:hypothetical protein
VLATPAVAAAAPGPATASPSSRLTLQAVGCQSFDQVPANGHVDDDLDETAGRYHQWGPVAEGTVRPLSAADLPAGCHFVEGVGFRVTASEHGGDLSPRYPNFVRPGMEDGRRTSRLPGATDAAGTLAVTVGSLSHEQQVAAGPAGTGLWVSSIGAPGEFANLRCHLDRYNSDNLEVVRSYSSDPVLACVLYVVGAPTTPAAPSPTSPPPPAPPPTEAPPAGPDADEGVDQLVDGPPSTTPPAPTTVPTAPPAAPATTTTTQPPASDELALPALGSLVVRIEVGGVTRGVDTDRSVGSESPWRRALRVTSTCGAETGSIDVVPPRAPGFSATLGPLTVPAAGATCQVTADDVGTLGGSAEVTIDREHAVPGVPKSVIVDRGQQVEVTVTVHYDGNPLGELERGTAPPRQEEPPSEVAAPPAEAPASSQLTPVISVTLGAVFVIGLALSILAARRPL